MSTETLIWVAVIVVAVVAIVAVGYVVLQQQRRHRLRERFGPEYDRTLRERENRREAEQELLAREQRFSSLDIRPLDDETRAGYAKKWLEVQERFVDAPGFAVTEADHLVTSVMADKGYPVEDFEQRIADLSVDHSRTLDHYRQAHEISGRAVRKAASTEELRQAMVHYRALFEELLGAPTAEAAKAADDAHVSRHAAAPPRQREAHSGRADRNGRPGHDEPDDHDVRPGPGERAGENERGAPRDSRGR
ncbi:hypothetical protein [Planobispora rosea]|uniref:hypothetical protein n=1 Tax=Planobispora rosea TaxID=35762 RepID=UPI000AFA2D0D|nr:hypothetical protein [Planobispora rosea]